VSDGLWTFAPDGEGGPPTPAAPGPRAPQATHKPRRPGRASAPEPAEPAVPADPAPGPPRTPRPRWGRVPRVGIVVVACAAVTGALVLAGAGPFHSAPSGTGAPAPSLPGPAPTTAPVASPPSAASSSTTGVTPAPPDVVGTWNLLVTYHVSFAPEHMVITAESPTTGAISGTVASGVGTASLQGKVSATAVSFVIRLGASAETCTATLSTVSGSLRMTGTFTNTTGESGGISAIRIAG